MSYSIKKNTKVAIEEEVNQGVYVAPTSGTSYIQVLEDGLEMNPSKELLERNLLGLGLSKATPRTGLRSVSGSIPVEMKAGSSEGSQPEYGPLMASALGSSKTSSASTSKTGNTTSKIYLEDADIVKYRVGDVVTVKQAGAYHKSPVTNVDASTGAAFIELLIPSTVAFSDAVVVAAFCTYRGEDSGHAPLSITKYVEDAVKEVAKGCIVTSMSVNNFTTGQLSDLSFGFEGLDFDRSLEAPAYIPSYDTSEPPIILKACIWMDGVEIEVNEFSLSVENTLGFIQNTCDGKKSSRVTARSVSGSINPYKMSNSISNFNKFNNNTKFSLFISAHTETGVAGEFKEIISFYLPNCIITELAEADADGVLQENLSFTSGGNGTLKEIYISMS